MLCLLMLFTATLVCWAKRNPLATQISTRMGKLKPMRILKTVEFGIYFDCFRFSVNPLPPGCLMIICAHSRAWEFYAESVYPSNQNAFLATKCNSITSLNSGKCMKAPIPMGYACPVSAKGNYFLNTKYRSPFGEQGLKKSEIVCSKCNDGKYDL